MVYAFVARFEMEIVQQMGRSGTRLRPTHCFVFQNLRLVPFFCVQPSKNVLF